MTVETFEISATEKTEVIRTETGDYMTRLVVNGQAVDEKWAFGSTEASLRNATAVARQQAFGIRFDRTR